MPKQPKPNQSKITKSKPEATRPPVPVVVRDPVELHVEALCHEAVHVNALAIAMLDLHWPADEAAQELLELLGEHAKGAAEIARGLLGKTGHRSDFA